MNDTSSPQLNDTATRGRFPQSKGSQIPQSRNSLSEVKTLEELKVNIALKGFDELVGKAYVYGSGDFASIQNHVRESFVTHVFAIVDFQQPEIIFYSESDTNPVDIVHRTPTHFIINCPKINVFKSDLERVNGTGVQGVYSYFVPASATIILCVIGKNLFTIPRQGTFEV